MPNKPSDIREANEKLPKKGGALDKYKWWLIGGLAVIAIAVFYFTSQSNQASQTSQTGTQPGIDPNTGMPYSMEMGGMGGMGGFPFMLGGGGGRGPAGPAGPAGKRGPRGKQGPPGKGKHHHKHHKHHHHHDGNGNGSSMSNLGALRAFGGNKFNSTVGRAAHNRRIAPVGVRHGPGMR